MKILSNASLFDWFTNLWILCFLYQDSIYRVLFLEIFVEISYSCIQFQLATLINRKPTAKQIIWRKCTKPKELLCKFRKWQMISVWRLSILKSREMRSLPEYELKSGVLNGNSRTPIYIDISVRFSRILNLKRNVDLRRFVFSVK